MFTLKVTQLAKLKEKWQQQRELEAEVERMVSQLQTASPEIALQVEEMMLRPLVLMSSSAARTPRRSESERQGADPPSNILLTARRQSPSLLSAPAAHYPLATPLRLCFKSRKSTRSPRPKSC